MKKTVSSVQGAWSSIGIFILTLFFTLTLSYTLIGCGGGGGVTPPTSAATGATLTGYALVPSSTPTTSASTSFLYFAKRLFFPELSAASTTKPLDKASVTVAKIANDGTLSTATSTTAATDDQGKYTLSNVPEGANLVVVATKEVKDDSGNQKTITLENLVTVSAVDAGKTKQGADLKVDTTLAVENVKEMIVTANSGKADSDKIDGSKLASDKVDEIKTVYANYNADINEKSNAVDIIAKDKNESDEDHHKNVIAQIEDLKNQISGLKSELETKINDILSSGTITGFIKDLSGNAVTSASVTVTGGALTTSKTATLFSSGQYTITLPVSTTAYTISISITGYKTITFTATIDRLMTLTKDITLTKVSAPVISEVTLSQSTVTVSGQLTLSVNAKDDDGDTVTCTWSATGGTLSASTGTSVTLTAPTSAATVTVTVKCSDGTNEVSATKDISVVATSATNQNPAVTTASSDATTGTAPLTVKFTGAASDNDGFVSSYFWDFGDGTSSNEQNPSHTYSTAGTYSVTLTVSDNAGGKGASTAITITITAPTNQPPTVTASASPTSGSAPLSVSFTATAKDADWCKSVCTTVIQNVGTAEWDYNGDGTADWKSDFTDQGDTFITSYSYTSAGTYTATFKATDKDGASSTKSVTITVGVTNKPPTASASASPTSGIAPLAVQFTGSGTDSDGSISSYSWDFGDGTTSAEQNPSKTFSAAGSYTITLTVTDNGGATGKSTTVVSATNPPTNQSPTATLSSDVTSGTTPLTVSFTVGYTDPESAAGTYSLSAGDNSAAKTGSINSGATATVSVTYSTAGTYTATVTVTDNLGATATKSVTTVTDAPNQSPTGALTASPSSGAALLNVSFTVSYTDPEGKSGTYSLNYGDNSGTATGSITSGGTATVTHTYSTAGTFTAALTVTDDKGATGSASASVSVSVTGIGAKDIACGWSHCCAVTTSGTVKCWGVNTYGELGIGTTTGPQTCDAGYPCSTTPVDVSGLSGVKSSTGGWGHQCVLTESGGVKCWGNNPEGQLGNGTTTSSSTPVDVTGLSRGVKAIDAGDHYTCALTVTGGIKCWGINRYGQFGNGTTTGSSTPVDVSGLSSGVLSIAAGEDHVCAVLNTGNVKCWGRNGAGQLGNGTTTSSSIPVDVVGISNVVSISTGTIPFGEGYTCALLQSGAVKCWGNNPEGQLGNGTTTSSSTPVDVSGLTSGVIALAPGGGNDYMCVIMQLGSVKCWGYGSYGSLGNGVASSSTTPVDVAGLTGAVAVDLTENTSCVVLSSGSVRCWGRNHYGQLGNGTYTGPSTCNGKWGGSSCSTTPVSVSGFGGSTGDVAVTW